MLQPGTDWHQKHHETRSNDHDQNEEHEEELPMGIRNADDSSSEDENEGVGFDLRPRISDLWQDESALTRLKSIGNGCVHRSVRVTICCCPERIHSKCLSSKFLLITYLTTIITLIIILSAGFYHVWDMYADSPAGGCLRDPKTMNNFRYILRSLTTVTQQYNISWWADFGVLLGGHQRGDILPWDRDLDISMFFEDLELLRNATVREVLSKEYGLLVCPVRKCIKPMWTKNNYPMIDINMWEHDGDTVRYWRTEEEKKDPIREAVFSKYNDFPLEYLHPLTTLTIGTVPVPVPGRYEDVLKVRYPHSYGISLPYNPRCWWSALTNNLERSHGSALLGDSFTPDISIVVPDEVHEYWPFQKSSAPGEPPVRYLLDADMEWTLNPEWIEYQRNITAAHSIESAKQQQP